MWHKVIFQGEVQLSGRDTVAAGAIPRWQQPNGPGRGEKEARVLHVHDRKHNADIAEQQRPHDIDTAWQSAGRRVSAQPQAGSERV